MTRRTLFLAALISVPWATTGCQSPDTESSAPRESSDPQSSSVALRDSHDQGPKILAVVAHPDDEITFAATMYAVSTELHGDCDVVVVTNGEGGYKYSTLAEPIYELELTNETVGRRHLPRIRRAEMLQGAALMNLRRVIFLEQKDHRYTKDRHEVLDEHAEVWDLESVQQSLTQILQDGNYDFLFTLLPRKETHGHHQAATLLALRAAQALPEDQRPVLLGGGTGSNEEPFHLEPEELIDDPLAACQSEPRFLFDRTRSFGHQDRLNYKILVNWCIAAHKSQGTMQLAMNRGDREVFALYACNGPDAIRRCQQLFGSLQSP